MSNGRGPTKLMSPRSTFQSCGSSSTLDRRSKAPNRVMRSPSGKSRPCRSRWSVMVRNLRTKKGTLLKPGRCWRNRIGYPICSHIKKVTATSNGESSTRPTIDTTTSNPRFSARLSLCLSTRDESFLCSAFLAHEHVARRRQFVDAELCQPCRVADLPQPRASVEIHRAILQGIAQLAQRRTDGRDPWETCHHFAIG